MVSKTLYKHDMNKCFAINIAWAPEDKDPIYYYKECFQICNKYNVGVVRVFLSPWGLYPIERASDLERLCEIIHIADLFNIEIVLVLDTYVNYVKSSYRDFVDSGYSWYKNYFSGKVSLAEFLSANGKSEYLGKMSSVLRTIAKYSNVKKIELCNEIDQIEATREKIVFWINNSARMLLDEYGDRFEYRVSISDYRAYKYYSSKIECKCDIHSYRFPYNTALENYEYLRKKFPLAWISEFGCFSDFAYADSIESHIYFNAMLLCAAFENCKDYPAPWWWEKIVPDSAYMSIYKCLDVIKDEFISSKTDDISIKEIEQIHTTDMKTKNKIRYRLSVLIKNPGYIKQEVPAITKFLRKRLWSKYNHTYAILGYRSVKGDQYFILETYVPIEICYKSGDGQHGQLTCKDITRSQQSISIEINETRTLCEGTYLIIKQN